MNSDFKQCSLFLYPEIKSKLDNTLLIASLKDIKFISKAIIHSENHFYTGENFLNYIAYMGCSPNIQFEASDTNESFCFIKVHHHTEKQLIVSQIQAKPPQCLKCKKPIKDWRNRIIDLSLSCNQCNATASVEKYNWRKMGGVAKSFIEITDIFPKEAIPQSALLEKLSLISDTQWHYFYSCQ